MTEKALAANRRNLEKAWLAPRDWVYRETERRLAAQVHNLERAWAHNRREFRRSIFHQAVEGRDMTGRRNFLGSLAGFGEKLKDFQHHLERLVKVFGVEAGAKGYQERLVRAMGVVAWKRLRVFRALALEVALVLQARLRQAAQPGRWFRRAQAEEGSRPRAELLLCRLLGEVFGRRVWVMDLQKKLRELLWRFERFGLAVLSARGEKPAWQRRARRQDRRTVREAAARELELGAKPVTPPQQWAITEALPEECHSSLRIDSLEGLQVMTDEELAEYFGLREGWEEGPPWVIDSLEALAMMNAGLTPREWSEEEEERLIAEARAEWLKAQEEQGEWWVAGEQDYVELFRAVLGEESRGVARAAWELMEVYRRQAEEEEARFAEILAGGEKKRARELMAEMLEVFRDWGEALWEVWERLVRLAEAFRKMLTRRHGERREWEEFRPGREWREREKVRRWREDYLRFQFDPG